MLQLFLLKEMVLEFAFGIWIKINGYRIHFWYMNKDKAINLLNDANLAEKYGSL